DSWDELGAISKCILWPPSPAYGFIGNFGPGTNAESITRFRTCIRAVRADYCGNGVTYTKDRTDIFLYDSRFGTDATGRAQRNSLGFKYEANWDENGAICVIHTRYLSLEPTCASTRFKVPEGLQGETYHCRAAPADLQGGVLMTDSTLKD